MLELKFDKTKCADCKAVSCLVKCQYMDFDRDKAKVEWQKVVNGEDSVVLHDCVTCYSCEEYCPFGNHPFYLIVERQEEKGILPQSRSFGALQTGIQALWMTAAAFPAIECLWRDVELATGEPGIPAMIVIVIKPLESLLSFLG